MILSCVTNFDSRIETEANTKLARKTTKKTLHEKLTILNANIVEDIARTSKRGRGPLCKKKSRTRKVQRQLL